MSGPSFEDIMQPRGPEYYVCFRCYDDAQLDPGAPLEILVSGKWQDVYGLKIHASSMMCGDVRFALGPRHVPEVYAAAGIEAVLFESYGGHLP